MKFVEWLDIDLGMLKLIEKLMNDFFGVILQYLKPPLKISTFHHMLDRVHISGKDLKNWLLYWWSSHLHLQNMSRNVQSKILSLLWVQKSHRVKLQVVRFQIPNSTVCYILFVCKILENLKLVKKKVSNIYNWRNSVFCKILMSHIDIILYCVQSNIFWL